MDSQHVRLLLPTEVRRFYLVFMNFRMNFSLLLRHKGMSGFVITLKMICDFLDWNI